MEAGSVVTSHSSQSELLKLENLALINKDGYGLAQGDDLTI